MCDHTSRPVGQLPEQVELQVGCSTVSPRKITVCVSQSIAPCLNSREEVSANGPVLRRNAERMPTNSSSLSNGLGTKLWVPRSKAATYFSVASRAVKLWGNFDPIAVGIGQA